MRLYYLPPEEGAPPMVVEHAGRMVVIQPPDQYWKMDRVSVVTGQAAHPKTGQPIEGKFIVQHRKTVFVPDPEKKGKRPEDFGDHSREVTVDEAKVIRDPAATVSRSTPVVKEEDKRAKGTVVVEEVFGLTGHIKTEKEHIGSVQEAALMRKAEADEILRKEEERLQQIKEEVELREKAGEEQLQELKVAAAKKLNVTLSKLDQLLNEPKQEKKSK